jgi:hypothetical protein
MALMIERVRVSVPVVTIQQMHAPFFTPHRAAGAQPPSPEVQCIAHDEATDEWSDGRLYDWFARGWQLMHTVRRAHHVFFYLQRRRTDAAAQAG